MGFEAVIGSCLNSDPDTFRSDDEQKAKSKHVSNNIEENLPSRHTSEVSG